MLSTGIGINAESHIGISHLFTESLYLFGRHHGVGGSPTEDWTEQCGPPGNGEVAFVNDEPALEPFEGDPPLPDEQS